MALANQEAQRFNHEHIGTEHILLGLVKEGSGVGANVLKNLDIDLRKTRLEVEKLVKTGPEFVTQGKLPQTPEARKVVEYSIEESRNLNHNYVGTEHLLLGLLREEKGVAAQVLRNLGLKLNEVREEVLNLLGAGQETEEEMLAGDGRFPSRTRLGKSKTPALDSFGRDLTGLAREGALDPVIGRRETIDRVIHVLCRRLQNSPVVLGDSGVGKTAIVEALAQRIASGDITSILQDKRIVDLDLTLLVAGTKYRGQFEERIKAVFNEVRRSKNIIVFIDEIEALVGAGTGEAAIDASNVIKPVLARGELQCIGATTPERYREHIETDTGLARQFQAIRVDPPSLQETIEILRIAKDRYESHHGVVYTDEAIELAVELADGFFPDLAQPRKSIDIIDEAGARVRMRHVFKSPEFDSLNAEIEQLDAEKKGLVQQADYERVAENRDRCATLGAKRDAIVRAWHESQANSEHMIDEDAITEAVAYMTSLPLEVVASRDYPVFNESGLPDFSLPQFERLQTESVFNGDDVQVVRGSAFVLIPHRDEFQAIYEQAIRPALEVNQLVPLKADDIYKPGRILNQVWQNILSAEVIIADMSGINPNVVYELGLCFAKRRFPIVLVTNPEDLPFDLRSLRCIPYENTVDGVAILKERLTKAVEAFIQHVRAPDAPNTDAIS